MMHACYGCCCTETSSLRPIGKDSKEANGSDATATNNRPNATSAAATAMVANGNNGAVAAAAAAAAEKKKKIHHRAGSDEKELESTTDAVCTIIDYIT